MYSLYFLLAALLDELVQRFYGKRTEWNPGGLYLGETSEVCIFKFKLDSTAAKALQQFKRKSMLVRMKQMFLCVGGDSKLFFQYGSDCGVSGMKVNSMEIANLFK